MALAVMVKLTGVPLHVPKVGVTVKVPVCVVAKSTGGVNEIFPLPPALVPKPVLVLVQAKVAPVEPEKLTVTGIPAQFETLAGVSMVGVSLTVNTTGVRFALTQPVTGSLASAKNVYVPGVKGPVGVNEKLLVSSGVPPAALANQSTCNPAAAVTVNAGTVAPEQMDGLLGVLGIATGGQLQLGAVTVC